MGGATGGRVGWSDRWLLIGCFEEAPGWTVIIYQSESFTDATKKYFQFNKNKKTVRSFCFLFFANLCFLISVLKTEKQMTNGQRGSRTGAERGRIRVFWAYLTGYVLWTVVGLRLMTFYKNRSTHMTRETARKFLHCFFFVFLQRDDSLAVNRLALGGLQPCARAANKSTGITNARALTEVLLSYGFICLHQTQV